MREPKEIIETPSGDVVLDFGQNLAGWFTFYYDEPEGSVVSVECAELMQENEFYRDNLRTAQAKLTYISNGKAKRVRPHFTFFGFRYLRIQGIQDVKKADFKALVFSSVSERSGEWETSNPLVNRLLENSRWGQLGNFIELPTDCPQRDERMGWTGDAQIFSATACYQYDSSAFYAKYLKDMWLEQQVIGGSVPFIIPSPKVDLMPGAKQSSGSCAWSDAATILPWTLYQFYGDRTLLDVQYQGMKAWVDYIRTQETEEHLWKSGFILLTGWRWIIQTRDRQERRIPFIVPARIIIIPQHWLQKQQKYWNMKRMQRFIWSYRKKSKVHFRKNIFQQRACVKWIHRQPAYWL